MPGKGGYEVCFDIKNNSSSSHLKILVISGSVERTDTAFMTALGADYFLDKPFNDDQFKAKISELLGES